MNLCRSEDLYCRRLLLAGASSQRQKYTAGPSCLPVAVASFFLGLESKDLFNIYIWYWDMSPGHLLLLETSLLVQHKCPHWTAFCKIFSEIPHLTIFGALKYAPKYAYLAYLAIFGIFGCIFGRAQYGQVGCPWKDLAKCSSDALVLGQ